MEEREAREKGGISPRGNVILHARMPSSRGGGLVRHASMGPFPTFVDFEKRSTQAIYVIPNVFLGWLTCFPSQRLELIAFRHRAAAEAMHFKERNPRPPKPQKYKFNANGTTSTSFCRRPNYGRRRRQHRITSIYDNGNNRDPSRQGVHTHPCREEAMWRVVHPPLFLQLHIKRLSELGPHPARSLKVHASFSIGEEERGEAEKK